MAQKAYHHKNLRRALVELAIGKLDAAPERNFSLRGLAKEIGVSSTASYAHFNSKADLLQAVVEAGFEEFGAAMSQAALSSASEAAAFRAFAFAYYDFSQKHPGLFQLMFEPPIHRPDDASWDREVPSYDALRDGVRALAPSLSVEEAVQFADLAMAMLHGIVVLERTQRLRSARGDKEQTHSLIEKAVAMLLLMLSTAEHRAVGN